jgi:hypothetical protein
MRSLSFQPIGGETLDKLTVYMFAASESLRDRPGAPLQAPGALTLFFIRVHSRPFAVEGKKYLYGSNTQPE